MISKRTGLLEAIRVPPSPFPGLRPFEFWESHLFFGRDGQIEKLLDKLTRTRFLAVVGTSGSGKSSLARAGLMPALRGGMMTGAGSNWRIAVMRPSNDPVGNLARALNAPDVFGSGDEENDGVQTAVTEATLRLGSRGLIETVRQNVMLDNENLLVVVDQFEELFRFAREARKEKDERFDNDSAAFVKLLLEAVKPNESGRREHNIYVALTMRSDFLGDCSQFWDLPEAINESQYLIPRLTRDQLREVITGPVALGGGEIMLRLVNQLLNDVGKDQDQLPILQHALMRTWNEWKRPRHEHLPSRGVVDVCCYKATGGMVEALSRHADEAYGELDARHQKIAERMFKALTERGEDNREIRRPATLGALAAVADAGEEKVEMVIEKFRQQGRSFLMPPVGTKLRSETLIDISHESLIRIWARLQQWVREEAESATIYHRLVETAELHNQGRSELWRGADLQAGLEWKEKNNPTGAWALRYHGGFETAVAFLHDSEQKRADEQAEVKRRQWEETERAKHELAQAQALAEAQTWAAESERQKAEERQRRLEEQARATSRLRRLTAATLAVALLAMAAAAVAFTARQKARAETGRANEQTQISEERARRLDALLSELRTAKKVADQKREEAEYSARKAVEQKQEADKQRRIAVTREREKATEVEQKGDILYASYVSLAGKHFDSNDFYDGHDLLNLFLPQRASETDRRGFYWRHLWKRSHDEQITLGEFDNIVTSVNFKPSGALVSLGWDGIARLWEKEHLDIFPYQNQEKRLWTVAKGQMPDFANRLDTLLGDFVYVTRISPDCLKLAGGKLNGKITIWDLTSGNALVELDDPDPKYGDYIRALDFNLEGNYLVSLSGYGKLAVWDLSTKKPLVIHPVNEASGASTQNCLALSRDGRLLAEGGTDGAVKLWDAKSGKELLSLNRNDSNAVISLAFSPNGKILAGSIAGGTVKLWDIEGGKESGELKTENSDDITPLEFSHDGRMLASAGFCTVFLWDINTRKRLMTFRGHIDCINSIAFSPDDETLASGGCDRAIKLWSVPDGKLGDALVGETPDKGSSIIERQILPGQAIYALSQDGTMLAGGGKDGTVKLCEVLSGKECLPLKGKHSKSVTSLAFRPDKKLLASIGEDGVIKLWDLADGHERGLADSSDSDKSERYYTSLSFSSDGSILAAGDTNLTLTGWDLTTGEAVAPLVGSRLTDRNAGKGYNVTSVAFSPDRKYVASGGSDGVIRLWDITTLKLFKAEKMHRAAVISLAFSPDGKTLVSGSDGLDSSIKLWKIYDKKQPLVLRGHQGSVLSVAFSQDGQEVLSGGDDKLVKLWDVRTGKGLAIFKGYSKEVCSVTFTTNMIASASLDGRIKLYFAAKEEEVKRQVVQGISPPEQRQASASNRHGPGWAAVPSR